VEKEGDSLKNEMQNATWNLDFFILLFLAFLQDGYHADKHKDNQNHFYKTNSLHKKFSPIIACFLLLNFLFKT